MGQFQAHRFQVLSVPQHLFHHLAEIIFHLKVFVLRMDIRIARDAHLHLFFHGIGGKSHIRVFQKHIFQRDVADLSARQPDHFRQRLGHRQKAENPLLVLCPQRHGNVNHFIGQVRKGMVGVNHQRRQRRQNGFMKIRFQILLFIRVQFRVTQAGYPVTAQNILQFVVQTVSFFIKRAQFPENRFQLFSRRHARLIIPMRRIRAPLINQASGPYHNKFIQVRGKNRHKPQPFQVRNGLILGFAEYPVIEFQPGKFPVLHIPGSAFLLFFQRLFLI